jgi:hypothetical protein
MVAQSCVSPVPSQPVGAPVPQSLMLEQSRSGFSQQVARKGPMAGHTLPVQMAQLPSMHSSAPQHSKLLVQELPLSPQELPPPPPPPSYPAPPSSPPLESSQLNVAGLQTKSGWPGQSWSAVQNCTPLP